MVSSSTRGFIFHKESAMLSLSLVPLSVRMEYKTFASDDEERGGSLNTQNVAAQEGIICLKHAPTSMVKGGKCSEFLIVIKNYRFLRSPRIRGREEEESLELSYDNGCVTCTKMISPFSVAQAIGADVR